MDFGKNITIRRLFEDERPAALDLAYASVGLGVMMIVSSLFCRYGAEVCDGKASLESMEHAES